MIWCLNGHPTTKIFESTKPVISLEEYITTNNYNFKNQSLLKTLYYDYAKLMNIIMLNKV